MWMSLAKFSRYSLSLMIEIKSVKFDNFRQTGYDNRVSGFEVSAFSGNGSNRVRP